MATFYFTYGTSRQFPYQGGWTEVDAPSGRAAYAAFRAFHPDQTEGTLNCSDVYPERAFKATKMYAEGNFGARCHERITLLRECNETAGASARPTMGTPARGVPTVLNKEF